MTRSRNDQPTSFLKRLGSSALAVVFTLLVVWVQVSPLSGSGIFDQFGNLLFDRGATYYDAGVHLSLISEMQHRFPPTNFALGGILLKNYHYLYDAALAVIVRATSVSIFDAYYRIGPVIISALLSLTIYLSVWRLTQNRWASALAIFFAVFGSSLGAITPLIKPILPGVSVSTSNNLYMTDQIYDMMVNPHGVLALVIFLSLFLCLSYYQQTKHIRYLIIFSLLLGLSFGIKAHGGVVFAFGSAASLLLFVKAKDWPAVLAIICGLTLMLIWFVSTTDRSVVGLHFAPLWFLDRFMADYEHLYQADFPSLIKLYLLENNWWHPAYLYFKAFLIYSFGSLGLRTLGLLLIVPVIKNPLRLVRTSPASIFLVGGAVTSFLIPLFFNQSTKPFDIVQFLPYFTLIMGIAFTIVLFQVIKPLPNISRTLIIIVFVTLFLILDQRELRQRLVPVKREDKISLSSKLLMATNYIRSNTSPDSLILLVPTEDNLGTLWFTAVAGRRTVLSGKFFSQQVGADSEIVEQRVKKAFAGESVDLKFDYLFLRQEEQPYFAKIREHYQFQQVFENDAAVIYQRN